MIFFFFRGKRRARIKSTITHDYNCTYCGSDDMRVDVYQTYQHVYLLPLYPVGPKIAEMKCDKCDTPK